MSSPTTSDSWAAEPEADDAGPWWRMRREVLLDIAAERGATYAYHLPTVRERADRLASLTSVDRVLYAMKANWHPQVIAAVVEEGLGVECVSPGEIERAFDAVDDLAPADVLFTPNFAPAGDYAHALERGVRLTLDSFYPLRHWPELFKDRELVVRVDPGEGQGHHRNVETAGAHTKFGVPLDEVDEMARLARKTGCRITGLHLHAGSGVTSEEHWAEAGELLFGLSDKLDGVRFIDVGGGLAVPSGSGEAGVDVARLDALLASTRAGRPEEVWLEPGRYVVADAGVLLARVTQTKGKGSRRYVGVETGMNSFVRPALYGARHGIVNLTRLDEPAREPATVVGPICESTDRLGVDCHLPPCREGDVLAVLQAGAYGRVMASEFNLRTPAGEVVLE